MANRQAHMTDVGRGGTYRGLREGGVHGGGG